MASSLVIGKFVGGNARGGSQCLGRACQGDYRNRNSIALSSVHTQTLKFSNCLREILGWVVLMADAEISHFADP